MWSNLIKVVAADDDNDNGEKYEDSSAGDGVFNDPFTDNSVGAGQAACNT